MHQGSSARQSDVLFLDRASPRLLPAAARPAGSPRRELQRRSKRIRSGPAWIRMLLVHAQSLKPPSVVFQLAPPSLRLCMSSTPRIRANDTARSNTDIELAAR